VEEKSIADKVEKSNFWDAVAVEAAREEMRTIGTEKWQKAARNWLVQYTEWKARDLIMHMILNRVRLKSDAKILDVGCGCGKWVNLFAERGFAVVGVDSSPWMIRLARKKAHTGMKRHVIFHVMDAARLAFPSDSFDMVNCVTVLQHILNDEDWQNAVCELIRVTKPMGYVLIFEAAPSFILKKRTQHMCFRTMKKYVMEFEKAGAHLSCWRATDLSFPITFLGLHEYASSFSERIYYYSAEGASLLSPNFMSLLSRIGAILAKPIDYRLANTPLSLLSAGKILLFRKAA
jgi:ubiquinone/menaquinone biosynthesis C-methylase UbiE